MNEVFDALARSGMSRLARDLQSFTKFREMPARQLAYAALRTPIEQRTSEEFEHMLTELVTRVYPSWIDEEQQ